MSNQHPATARPERRLATPIALVSLCALALALGGCALRVGGTSDGAVVGTSYYTPMYYQGYVVYYDEVGRPVYYVGGVRYFVPAAAVNYHLYVGHYRRHRAHYHRWYRARGHRYRRYRRRSSRANRRGVRRQKRPRERRQPRRHRRRR